MMENGNLTTVTAGFEFQSNSTDLVINQLRLATSTTVRKSTVILASFNAIGGLLLAMGIFSDCYRSAKRADSKLKSRNSAYKVIGPITLFPFVLAVGITIQGIIIAVEQSKGLHAQLVLGCRHISQVMLPTIFIVPFIQFIFGMEITARAFRRRAFASFGKWTMSTCLGLVFVSLIATYAVGRAVQPPNFCFASLFWFLQRWRVACFALFIVISASLLLGSLITFVRLYKDDSGGPIDRIYASRMVYYMSIGALTNIIVIPFFASLTIRNDMDVSKFRGNLSMAAMVSTNLTALINGGLYVFLRTCQGSSNIGRRGYFKVDCEKQNQDTKEDKVHESPITKIYTKQMEQPVSPPPPVFQPTPPTTTHNRNKLLTNTTTTKPSRPPPTKSHKASYTLFPHQQQSPPQPQSAPLSQQEQQSQTLTPAAKPLPIPPVATYTAPSIAVGSSDQVHDDDMLDVKIGLLHNHVASLLSPDKMPAFATGDQTNSDRGSSATVQIGLRLSNVDDVPSAAAKQNDTSKADEHPSPWPLRAGNKAGDRDSQVLLNPVVYSPESTIRNESTTKTTLSDIETQLSSWRGFRPTKRPSECI